MPAMPLTNPDVHSSTSTAARAPQLKPGPYYPSFEKFRTSGITALEGITSGTVATLVSKAATYRILRDEDFQKLLGLATEVHRIKSGVTIVVQAAKVVAKHHDQESIQMLVQSAALLSESCMLPEREGHEQFELTPEELAEEVDEQIDLASISRPAL